MSWIGAIFLALLLVALTRVFIINAQRINRDMNRRLDEFQARLENDANSVVDAFLKANQADDVRPHPRASGAGHSSGDGVAHNPANQ
jgi:hypothetical protein